MLTNASAHTGQRCEIPWGGVTGSCKSPDVAVESNLGSEVEQCVLVSPEPSLQPLKGFSPVW